MILEAKAQETAMLRDLYATRERAVRDFDIALVQFLAAREFTGGTFKAIVDATHVEFADLQPVAAE